MKKKVATIWDKLAIKLRCYLNPEQLVVLLTAIIIIILLFIPPIAGDADNGTFVQTLHGNGLYQLHNYHYYVYDYVSLKYGIMQYFNSYQHPLFSTSSIFIQIAILLNKLFYSTKIFDIRFLGLTYSLFYLGAIYLLTKAFTSRRRTPRDYVIALIIWFIFGDSALILFFNSFYIEPVQLITILYAFASYALIARHYYHHTWPIMTLYILAMLGFIEDKQQNTFFVVGWVIATLAMLAITHTRLQKVSVVLMVTLIVGAGVVSNCFVSTKYTDQDKYQSMTCGVLAMASNPEKTLAEGGISPQFSLLKNDPYSKTYTALKVNSKEMKEKFLGKYNYFWIASYYLQHWSQFEMLLNTATKNALNIQMKGLGNYQKAKGIKPTRQNHFNMLFLLMMNAFFPRKFMFYVVLLLVDLGIYIYVAYRGLRERKGEPIMRSAMVVNLIIILIGTFFGTVIGGGDADLANQLFMVPVSLFLLIFIFIIDLVRKQLW